VNVEEILDEDEEDLEKQMALPSSLMDLNSDHFPVFTTTKRLLYMVDATLSFPFFSRNIKGEIIGTESSV